VKRAKARDKEWFMRLWIAIFGVVAFGLVAAGCSESDKKATPDKPEEKKGAEVVKKPLIQKAEVADWCPDHGVPESICTRCQADPKPFIAKGDWCKKHELPDTQCFVCHPELQAKFAKAYEDKYKKKPPVGEEK
jgi:hypothetical protein